MRRIILREGDTDEKNIRSCLYTVVEDGVKEEIVEPKDLPKRAQKVGKYSGYDCFLLEDGRYAYRDYDPEDTEHKKPVFYRVLTIEDERKQAFLECLDFLDQEEERINRSEGELKSKRHERYKKRKDRGEDEAEDPVEKALYNRYYNDNDDRKTRPLPLPAQYAVIKCAIQQMTPADQRVYEMGYDSYLSDMDMRLYQILDAGETQYLRFATNTSFHPLPLKQGVKGGEALRGG